MMEHLANLFEIGARNVAYDRPMLGRAALGGSLTLAGQSAPLLSLLDSPRRGVAGGLMSMLGQTRETPEGVVQRSSIYPALAGLAAAGATALMPGGIALSPYVGALTTGLAQQVGEYFKPNDYASFSPGEVNQAIGVPSNILTDIANSLLTDPMTYAGLASGMLTNLRKARQPSASPTASPMAEPSPTPAAVEPPPVPVAAADAPIPPPYAIGLEPPMPGMTANDLLSYRVAKYLDEPVSHPMMGFRPMSAEDAIEIGNRASAVGYRPDLLEMAPDYLLPPFSKPKTYKHPVSSDVDTVLESLGIIRTDPRPRPGQPSAYRMYDLPPDFAEVRGGRILPVSEPHRLHGINYSQTLLDQEGTFLADELFRRLLRGKLPRNPADAYARLRQQVMQESAEENARRAAAALSGEPPAMSPYEAYLRLKAEAEGL